MVPAILVLAFGYFVSGALGDFFFKRTPRGRVLVAMVETLAGAVLPFFAINIPIENHSLFLLFLLLAVIFIPFASPNVISTVFDITLPEVRSIALAVQYFIEDGGAAFAPLLAGFIARESSLQLAILLVCTSAWALGTGFLAFTAYFVPQDIRTLRKQMSARAEIDRQASNA
jgi:hypothetical protein